MNFNSRNLVVLKESGAI